jgi:uncharacterized protein with HEPN domain
MKKDPVIYLSHIHEAITAILNFTRDITEEEFYHSDLIISAVVRKFEIMGEAAKRIPDEIRLANPEIPWKQMAGFRDVLIHDYDGLNLNTIWVTTALYLPALEKQIQSILDKPLPPSEELTGS